MPPIVNILAIYPAKYRPDNIPIPLSPLRFIRARRTGVGIGGKTAAECAFGLTRTVPEQRQQTGWLPPLTCGCHSADGGGRTLSAMTDGLRLLSP